MYGYDAIMALQSKINYWMFTQYWESLQNKIEKGIKINYGKTNAFSAENMDGSQQ